MKLHLPKQLFTALLAAIACWQPVTATDYTYGTDDNNVADKLTAPTDGDTITFNKASGYLTSGGGTINAKVIINELTLTDGYSNSKYTFRNTVTGAGNFSFGGSTGANNQHYVFDGDASGYSGNMSMADSKTGSFTFNNKSGTGTISGANVTVNANSATMNNSAITVSTVNVSGTTSFAGTVDTGSLTIAADSAVTFSGNLTVGTTIVNNGSISLENGAKVVLEDISAFDNAGWGDAVDYSAESNGVQTIDVIYTIEKGSATSKLSSVWYQGSEQALDNGCLTEAADIYVVVSDEVTVGGNSATEGTADVAGFAVGENGTLKIAGASSALSSSKILGSTTGTGTMVLSTAADVVAGQSLTFEGTLKLSSGGTLNFGKAKGAQADMSNLSSLIFDGGTLNYNAAGSEIKNVTVTTNGGTMNVQDFINLDQNPGRIEFTGDTALNGNLTYHTTYKSLLTVEHLTGSGNFTISTANNADGGANVVISSMTGYAGTLILNGQVANGASRNPVAVTATLDSGYTLNASQVQINNVAGSLSLTGSGTYNLGASKTMTTGVSLAGTWEGSVKVTGTVSGEGDAATLSRYDIYNLDDLEELDTTDKGKVVLSGVNGYFTAAQTPAEGDTFSADIVLENYELNGTSHAALTINDGYDRSSTGRYTIINGSISGSGDLEFAKKSSDAKYLIQGNVSGWNGTLKATKNTLYLVAGGEATTWNAAIIDKQGANNAGTINLSVDNTGKTTTFSKEVSVSSLTVTENTSITLGGGTTEAPITHSIGTLSAASGTVSVAENGTLSLGTATHSIGTLSAASGTVSVAENGTLSLGTATHSIGTLTGGGLVTTVGNLSITNAPAGFTGALKVQGSTATVTNATRDFTLKNLTLDGSGSESGASFEIVARGTNGTTGYSYNIEQLTVSGTGTLANTNPSGAPGYQSQWNIGNLTNAEEGTSGVLNLNSWTKTDNRSIINLNGGDFAGEINLLGNSNTGTRKAALNVNAETAAADAVVSLSSSGQKVALGIGADRVVLKGINGSAGSIISGAQAYHKDSTAYNGDDFNAIDTTFRTLVIDTNGTDDTAAVNSSTSATLGSYLNLEKQGAGTQTFSGDMSGFNGTIVVTGGTLKFTSGFTASSATISQGAELKLSDTATVTNGTMSQVKLNSTGISSADTTGTTKGNISGANVEIAQLAEEASFTIQDMTLTNTTITAATTTQVKLQNVEATNLALAQGKFTMNVAPTVDMGGTTANFGTNTDSSFMISKLTAGSASLTLNLDVMGAYESTGAVDKVTLTITLAGITGDVSRYGVDDWKALVGFEEQSWLGQALTGAEYTVPETASAAEGGVPSVNYGYASTGSNVGTLTITISGLNVPEPASATLGLAALMMLCARRRRKA